VLIQSFLIHRVDVFDCWRSILPQEPCKAAET